MRYTTIIDVTAAPWYRNKNVVLVYLHMTLTCGYHDADRDLYTRSIRSLASDSGVSFAACRHALRILERDKMIHREGSAWRVSKWIAGDAQPVTPRPKSEKEKKLKDVAAERAAQDAERDAQDAERARYLEQLRQNGKTPYMLYYETKMKEAEAGDLEAAEIVRRNRHIYEAHRKKIEEEQQNENKQK